MTQGTIHNCSLLSIFDFLLHETKFASDIVSYRHTSFSSFFFFFFDKQTFHIYVSHLINQDPNFPMKFGIKFLMFDEISYCILNEICSSNFMHGLWLISFWTPIFLLEQRVNSTYFYFLFLFFFNEMLEGDLIWEQKPNQFWCKAQIMLNLWIMVLSSRFCAF